MVNTDCLMFKIFPMKKVFIGTVVLLMIMTSCKTASKAYDQGDYSNAVELTVKKLQKDPQDADAKRILQQAYKNAVELHEDRIRILNNNSDETKWEKMLHEYQELQNLYHSIQQYPASANAVHAIDYSSFIETYRNKAADVYTERGRKYMNEDNKTSYRQAYNEFRNALRFRPKDYELETKMQEAYDLALVKVILLPMDVYNMGYYYNNNSFQMRNFQNQLIRSLNNRSGSNFIKFYSNWEAQRNLVPDEVLEMRLGRVRIGQPYDQQSTRRVSKEVVVKETVYKKDSVVKEYAKVYANIITTKRTLVSEADLFVTSRDNRGKILWSDNFNSEHRWQVELATYTGDERALDESDKALLNQNNIKVPREEDIMQELLRQLENNLSYRLRNYYQRYHSF